MNNDEKNVNDELKNFFDNDFLEINIEHGTKNIINDNIASNKDFNNKVENISLFSNDFFEQKDSIETKTSDINYSIDENSKPNIKPENNNDIEENIDNKNANYKKILICFLIGILIGGIIIFIIINYVSNVERKANCSFEAKDNNFKNTDEYTITYKGNKINYVEGIYIYNALTDDFKPQIEYIKEEKLPVIINSNGMPGFTHIYESSDDYLKILSYYDVTLFDFNIVDKNDDKATPISYINLKSDITYKKLIETLEKKGYKCTQSK